MADADLVHRQRVEGLNSIILVGGRWDHPTASLLA